MMKITVVTDDNRFFEYVRSAVRMNGCIFVKYDRDKAEESVKGAELVVVDLLSSDKQIPAGGCPVAVFSAVPAYSEAIRFLQKGVKGYGNRFMNHENLNQMVHTVLAGQVWLPPAILSRLIASVPQNGTSRLESGFFNDLSEREQQVAELIGRGMSNKEIAEFMGITIRTVKAHLSSVFVKTGCRDRLEVALRLKGSI
ncbi:MAG: LuxR C-terminal-related transcriptional regulator [Deferribacterales bacterium]